MLLKNFLPCPTSLILGFLTVFTAFNTLKADENDWFVPLGRPPEAPPKHISGGEGYQTPPPLPASTQRRTERKRQPTPPSLFGKVIWGEEGSFTYSQGAQAKISDWNLCPADLKHLFEKVQGSLGLQYGYDEVSLPSFSGDPDKMAVLFFSGTRTLKLDNQALEQLRDYVLRGGMLCFDSVAGSPYFYDSVHALMKTAFPELAWHVLPPDHPLYHMVKDVGTVGYSSTVHKNQPYLEALYVGSRAAVILSKYGLGCGWDDHDVPLLAKAQFYDAPSADAIGLNLVAYAIGYNRVGINESRPELFATIDEKAPSDEFVFAQIQHEGAFNVHPNSATSLLEKVRATTSLKVSLKRQIIDLDKNDLSKYSFLYLTGLDDFHFSNTAVNALRTFLQRNGTLFINNGLGLSTFDVAVRREMEHVLPGTTLDKIPLDHPIFSDGNIIKTATYSPFVKNLYGNLNVPLLEGISINGDLRVIYSPIDLEAGWTSNDYPSALTYKPDTADILGINILLYASTH